MQPDLLIVGGGVIGLTTAYVLAGRGWRVEVLDRSQLGMEASWAGAGIIPPGNPECARTAYDRLRAVSSQQFPGFSQELLELTGIDNGYRACGGIEFLEADDDHSVDAWIAEQVPFEELDDDWLLANEPAVNAVSRPAFFFPGAAQVRNPRHLRTLIAACTHRGVSLRAGMGADALDHRDGRIVGIELSSGERRVAAHYLIAAGAWSARLLQPLGIRTGIHPVRGQIVLLKTPSPLFRRILMAGKRYLVPRDDGHVLVGSTEEPEAGFVKETTGAATSDLLEFARRLVPDLAKAEVVQCWAGLRPGTVDGLPNLGRAGDFSNLWLAAGHFRAGIQLSPATASVMADLLDGKTPAIPLDDFRPGREPANPVRSAFRS